MAALVNTYGFGFQRFTRQVSQAQIGSSAAQGLMTPPLLGLIGWVGTIGMFAAAGALWAIYGWKVGVGYYVAFVMVDAVIPFGPLRGHYAKLALGELSRQMYRTTGEAQNIVAGLMAQCMYLS